jgi:polysaccharide biosynthesis transport protein
MYLRPSPVTFGTESHEERAAPQRDEGGLRHPLAVLRRRWVVVVAATIVLPATALALSLAQDPRYEGRADVLLSQVDLASTLTGAPIPYQDPERFVQTQADLARSPAVARAVLAEEGGVESGTSAFLDRSDVLVGQGSDLLTFTVEDSDQQRAGRLANAYARAFVDYRRRLDVGAYGRALTEIRVRLDELGATGDRELRRDLESKLQQLQTLQTLSSSNATVVRESARGAQIQPRPLRNTVLAVVLGIALGLGAAFLWEALDIRLRSAHDVSQALELPLLARVPAPASRDKDLVMLSNAGSPHAEPFRVLRIGLEMKQALSPFKTLMVTSALQGEGKSTTVANLAVALARAGRDVLLVDVDLRRPYVHRYFDHDNARGLTSVALGTVPYEDALFDVDLREGDARNSPARGRLRVLPSGPIPPDPGEFVDSHLMDRILDEIRGTADVILFDAPPLLGVADAVSLSARADAVILVARLRLITRPTAREAQRLLNTTGARVIGYVLTGADTEPGYGYGYSYEHGDPDTARSRRNRAAAEHGVVPVE